MKASAADSKSDAWGGCKIELLGESLNNNGMEEVLKEEVRIYG